MGGKLRQLGATRIGRVLRWFPWKRIFQGLGLLIVVAVLGFEFWRQYENSAADKELGVALEELKDYFESYPSPEEFYASHVTGTNGSEHWLKLIGEGARFSPFFEQEEQSSLPFLTPSWGNEQMKSLSWAGQAPSDAEIQTWLDASQPIADHLRAAASSDCIVVNVTESDDWTPQTRREVTLYLFFWMMTADLPFDRIRVLYFRGSVDEALSEFKTNWAVSQKLVTPLDTDTFLQFLSFRWRTLAMAEELAEMGILDTAIMREILDFKLDNRRAVRLTVEGELLLHARHARGLKTPRDLKTDSRPGWFAWLNPANYERWNGNEFWRNSLRYPYERRAQADWYSYSNRVLDALKSNEEIPEISKYTEMFSGYHATGNWSKSLARLRGRQPLNERRRAVLEVRIMQLEGRADAAAIAKLDSELEHVGVSMQGDTVLITVMDTDESRRLLGINEDSYRWDDEEFRSEYPVIRLAPLLK